MISALTSLLYSLKSVFFKDNAPCHYIFQYHQSLKNRLTGPYPKPTDSKISGGKPRKPAFKTPQVGVTHHQV